MKVLVTIATLLTCCLSFDAYAQQAENDKTLVNSHLPYSMVEKMPEYIGGNQALQKHLKKHLKQAPRATEGVVFVSFVIHEDSTISDITIMKPLNAVPNNLVIETVEAMKGQWSPGTQFSVQVKVRKVLPIHFPISN